MQPVLTIAGYDPSSGAGITADLMVFAAHRRFGTSAITALTVQSTPGVLSTHPVEPAILRATLLCLQEDVPAAGIKIGMLATGAQVEVVCDFLQTLRNTTAGKGIPVVLDPVLQSSSGRELLDSAGVSLLRARLLPLVDWVTPNLQELAFLTGMVVAEAKDLPGAAQALQNSVPRHTPRSAALGIFATGGHLHPPDDFVLSPLGKALWLPGQRVDTRATHGTGCALSSAFLCELVIGRSSEDAAAAAKAYVAGALERAVPLGQGSGPMQHLWPLSSP